MTTIPELMELYEITEDEARCISDASIIMKTFGVLGSPYYDRHNGIWPFRVGYFERGEGTPVHQRRYKTARGMLTGVKRLSLSMARSRIR